ncbi:MAG: GldG family protein [Verrucomicrobiota bacterium]|nr:GldG family protein [Verrucomicrobiota bacterium]
MSDGGPKKIRRWQIGANVVIQVALLFLLTTMVNYWGFEHYKRWDYSRDHRYQLSDKTKRVLDSLKSKLRITVFFSNNTPITADVQNLLTEIQYAARAKVDVEQIDPDRDFARAKELVDKYKVVSDESLLVLDYEGRNKTVKASEMADIDRSGAAFGEGPRVTAFKGEQVVTAAILDLVEGKKNIVGYVLGHKEPALTDTPTLNPLAEPLTTSPISVMKTFVENGNVKFQELNLFNVPAIPADVRVVMILGPQYDFSDREMQLLRDFWNKQGRILVLLDPTAKTPKLSAFLKELGITEQDDRLMAVVRTGIEEMARVRDVVGRFLPDSPITKKLADARGAFFGATCSLGLEQARVQSAGIQLRPLVQAEKGYWGEVDYNSDDPAKLQFNQGRDFAEPLIIAASVENGGSPDERVQVNAARLVVVSNSTFVQDSALTQDQQALDFVAGSLDWLMSREQLIGIAPKVPHPLTFSLDETELRNLRWLILVVMPLIPALLGLLVWWKRRA